MKRPLQILGIVVCATGSLQSARAQVIIPRPPPVIAPINTNPAKPNIVEPAGVVGVTQSQTTSVTLRWYQPVLTLSSSARDAAYFVLCLQESSLSCSYGTAGQGIWSGPAVGSSFSRTPVFSGSPFTTGPRLLQGYNYSTTVTLDNTFYNRWIYMRVGACATAQNSSCTFATTVRTAFSSVDLVADNTGSISNTPTQEHFYGQARNIGTGNSGMFIGAFDLRRIELTQYGVGYPWTCQTDPNAPGLNLSDDDGIINWNGDHYSVGSRRNPNTGVIDTTGLVVKGIYREGADTYYERGQLVTLSAGASAGIVARDVDITRPIGFVIEFRVDGANLVPEVDKSNNQRADCLVVQ